MSAWSAATLATDDDLTAQESRMPALAQKIVQTGTGKTAYDGKRALAKADIGRWIERRGFKLDGVSTPAQFARAAVFLELSYIYRDLATRNDEISAQKADFYRDEYAHEIEALSFDYEQPTSVSTTTKRPVATLWRS